MSSSLTASAAAHPEARSQRRRVRRTAIVLGLVAGSFYLGFIAMAVYKAMH
ncbi:MAG TPA: hypothetical protein VME21_11305 [Steroidobacteraceae bacterium]|nr:hypothetical protein [Steroidobacteraceae bacterium]